MPFAVDGFCANERLMSAIALSRERVLGRTRPCRCGRGRCPPSRRGTRPCRPSPRVTAFVDVERDRADLGVRHEAARTEDTAELTDRAHHVGRRDHAVEVHEAFLDLGHELVAAGEIGAGRAASRSFSPLANTSTRTRLPGAVRQHERAADHLVGVLGIDARDDGEVDGLVELGVRRLLHERARLFDACTLRAVDDFVDLRAFLGDFRHLSSFRLSAFGLPPVRSCRRWFEAVALSATAARSRT